MGDRRRDPEGSMSDDRCEGGSHYGCRCIGPSPKEIARLRALVTSYGDDILDARKILAEVGIEESTAETAAIRAREEIERLRAEVERLTRERDGYKLESEVLFKRSLRAEAGVAELEGAVTSYMAYECVRQTHPLACMHADACVCGLKALRALLAPPAPADHLTGVGKMVAEEFECPRGHGPMTGFNPEFGTPACSSCGAEPAKCGTCAPPNGNGMGTVLCYEDSGVPGAPAMAGEPCPRCLGAGVTQHCSEDGCCEAPCAFCKGGAK